MKIYHKSPLLFIRIVIEDLNQPGRMNQRIDLRRVRSHLYFLAADTKTQKDSV